MTSKADRQDAVPMLAANQQPDLYRLLAVFSGIARPPLSALVAAGLHSGRRAEPISEYHRSLLRLLAQQVRIRWITEGPDGPGYVLTGYGEVALVTYQSTYGPAHAPRRWPPLREILVFRVMAGFTLDTPRTLRAALTAAEVIEEHQDVANIHKEMLAILVHAGYLIRDGDGYVTTTLGQIQLEMYQERCPKEPRSRMKPRKDRE